MKISKRPKVQGITRNVAANIRHSRRITRILKQKARRLNRARSS